MWRTVLLSFCVCVVAVAARQSMLSYFYRIPWVKTESELVAVALVRGDGWADPFGPGTGPTAHVAPLYPLVLAGIYEVFGSGEHDRGKRVQQYLALAMTIVGILLLPAVARKLGLPVAVGWVAAFVAAAVPGWRGGEVSGQHEQTAGTIVLLGLVWCCADLRERGWVGRRAILRMGLLTGLAALLIPNILAVPALYFLAELVRDRGERGRILRCGVTIAAVCAVMMTPWVVRNYVVLGGFVPVRSNLGLELFIGNRPGTNGRTYAGDFVTVHPLGSASEREHLARGGELAYMREKRQQAVAWIAANPDQFARLTLLRFYWYWFDPETRPEESRNPITMLHGLLAVAVFLSLLRLFWIGSPAALLLLCVMLGVSLPYYVTHVEPRYRQPLFGISVLMACDLAWACLRWGWGRFRCRGNVPGKD